VLKVAIVGCGKIADDHASQIKRITGCEMVGVCDSELLMARQFYERFPVKQYFNNLQELLSTMQPDVVHVCTPPQSHFGTAKLCLEAGSHVYVEKPFALSEEEANALIVYANNKGLKITAGHDDQFRPAARRMRALVQNGYLGGSPVHMESYYCYELSDDGYAGAVLGDKHHWVRRLPGKLLHTLSVTASPGSPSS
jgi:predicted dehydrogenase